MLDARKLWDEGRYQECAAAMKVEAKATSGLQASHNALLASHFATGGQEARSLFERLAALEKDKSKLATSSNDSSDPAVVRLNMAILLTQQNQPAEALKLLESLFESIEPMQETVAVRVCLLLTELYLSSSSFAQAAKVLQYLETAYGVPQDGPEDRESLLGQNSDLELGPETPALPEGSDQPRSPRRAAVEAAGANSEGLTSPPKSDSIGSGVTEEGEIAAVLGRMLDQAGRLDAYAANQGNCFLQVGGLPMVQLVRILRARLNLALNQLRSARRDIKAILAADPNSLQGISLRAHLELQRQSYRKSARILTLSPTPGSTAQAPILPREGSHSPGRPLASPGPRSTQSMAQSSSSQPQEDVRQVAMLSNLGLVQHSQGKPNTAALCFTQALHRSAQLASMEGSQGGSKLPHNAELQIAYSAGLQALQLGKYSSALRCFQAATAALSKSPALWLRMADCCVGVLSRASQDAAIAAEAAHLTALTGQDDWWRILRPDCLSAEAGCAHSYSSCAESIEQAQVASQACRPVEYTRTNRQYLQQQDEGAGSTGHRALIMFATQCLQNCVYLSHQSLQHIVKSGNGQAEDPSSSLAGGGSHPSNGPKVVAAPARASVGKGSAAEAAQQMAMLSIDRSRAVSSAMDAAVAAAADRHRQEMQSIISAAFASLAWLQLQKQHWQLAKHTCEAWLTVPGISQEHQLLALMYTAEALCHLQGSSEAAQQLQQAIELQTPASNGNSGLAMYCHVPDEHGNEASHNKTAQALQVAALVNAASLQASEGHLQQAQTYAARAAQLQPNSQQALLTLIYVELCKGNSVMALTLLKQQQLPTN